MRDIIPTTALMAALSVLLASSTPLKKYPALASAGQRGPGIPLPPPTVLTPVSKSDFAASALSALPSHRKRETEFASSLTPRTNVTLYYQSSGSAMVAEVDVMMKYPSVMLEDVAAISSVACTRSSVSVTFQSPASYDESRSVWPPSAFLLFTKHRGACDATNERGIYLVKSITSDRARLLITAATDATSWTDAAENMDLSFVTPSAAASRRDMSKSFSTRIPCTVTVANVSVWAGDTVDKLSVTASNTTASGSFALRGRVSFSFWKFKFTNFYLDLGASAAAATSLDLNLTVTYDAPVWTFAPLELSVAAFEIGEIFSIGPGLAFELGVELLAEEDLGLTADLAATLTNGLVHLDLLRNSSTYTSGWDLEFAHQVNTTGATQVQVHPYVSLNARIRAELLGAYTTLEASIIAKPDNVVDLEAPVNISNVKHLVSSSNVTLARSNSTLMRDLWSATSFLFHVTLHVSGLFSHKLYEVPLRDLPTLENDFWSMEYFDG
ncbi:unnamed protein product [Diplocarpon coronariae]